MTAELVTKGGGKVYSLSGRTLLGPPKVSLTDRSHDANSCSNVTSHALARPAANAHYAAPEKTCQSEHLAPL
jgi:hypothetical protein